MHLGRYTAWQTTRSVLVLGIALNTAGISPAAPPGFIKSTIALDAPPAGLAFDAGGVLYALEGAPFGSNQAVLRAILPDGTVGDGIDVYGNDPDYFFAGDMAYDPLEDHLLISDNTTDGRLYAVDKDGHQQTLATGINNIAGVAVRSSGEIFVTTAPFGSAGAVLQVSRTTGATTTVLPGLALGAGLAFDSSGDLFVQDAVLQTDGTTVRGRVRHLPITDTPSGLQFGTAELSAQDMQSSAGLAIDDSDTLFATGSGGLYQLAGVPLAELPFDDNGRDKQFATSIAFDPGTCPFGEFAGPDAGRLAYMADYGWQSPNTFVTLLTPAVAGDYNLDGQVDGDDYNLWKDTFGSTEDLGADGNGDGVVDAADYTVWRDHAGLASGGAVTASERAVPWAPLRSSGRATAVPEPSGVILVGLALAPAALLRRRCRRPPRRAAG